MCDELFFVTSFTIELRQKKKLWWGERHCLNHKDSTCCHIVFTFYRPCALLLHPCQGCWMAMWLLNGHVDESHIQQQYIGLLTWALNTLTDYMILAITGTEWCVPCRTFRLQVSYNTFPSPWPSYYCLLSHQLLQIANPSFFILLEKPGAKGIVGYLMDSQEHKAKCFCQSNGETKSMDFGGKDHTALTVSTVRSVPGVAESINLMLLQWFFYEEL